MAGLVTPRASLRRSFVAALREYQAEGRHLEREGDGSLYYLVPTRPET